MGIPHKIILMQGYFYEGHAVDRQLEFMDRFLHDKDNNVKNWPKVRLEVRERYFYGKFIDFPDFPVPNTKYVPLYLDSGSLSYTKPTSKSSVEYDSDNGRVTFSLKFDKETAMVGYSKLRIAFQAPDNDDADIFVALKKFDDEGDEVTFTYFTVYEHGPIAQGCLRASHRAIDASRSKLYQPRRNHDKEELLDPRQVYEMDIELLAATARFLPGDSLQLVIGGTDITKCKPSLSQKHAQRKNKGRHLLWTGPEWDAHLLFPVVEGLELGAAWGNR
jgi:predicted acyl esterase